jgi:hypothetical protein
MFLSLYFFICYDVHFLGFLGQTKDILFVYYLQLVYLNLMRYHCLFAYEWSHLNNYILSRGILEWVLHAWKLLL